MNQSPLPMPDAGPMDDDEISLLDLLQVVADNLRLLVLGPLAVGLLALGISFAITPTFTARTTFLVPQGQSSSAAMLASLGALGGLAGAAGLKSPGDQFVTFAKSDSVQDAMVQRFGLMQRYELKFKDDARTTLEGLARVTNNSKDGTITIEVDEKDPKFAAEMANGYVQELQNLMNRLAITEAQQRRVFFEELLTKTKDDWVKAEQALKASGFDPSTLKLSPAGAAEGTSRVRAAIMAQEIKLASMRGYLAQTAPEFRQAQTELQVLQNQLARMAQDEPQQLSDAGSDYMAKLREAKYQETLHDLFLKQFQIARIDESKEGSTIQVIDPAQVPERKSKPKKALIAVLATLATGFALLLFVFVRNAVHNAAQDTESAQKLAQLRSSLQRALGRR